MSFTLIEGYLRIGNRRNIFIASQQLIKKRGIPPLRSAFYYLFETADLWSYSGYFLAIYQLRLYILLYFCIFFILSQMTRYSIFVLFCIGTSQH